MDVCENEEYDKFFFGKINFNLSNRHLLARICVSFGAFFMHFAGTKK